MKPKSARCFLLIGSLLIACSAASQDHVIDVWPGAAPGSEGWTQREAERSFLGGASVVCNVVKPTLTAYLPDPDKATGTAMIVAPGGGFYFLSWENEGTKVAEWLAEKGVAAFILKYRLVDTGATDEEFRRSVAGLFVRIRTATSQQSEGTRSADDLLEIDPDMGRVRELAVADGRQAVKVVRERASEWGVSPDRIGIMGFSAGGMVTMGVAMSDEAATRPNFAAPIYGGSTMGEPIPADAPPLFILCAHDDALASAGSARLYTRWQAAGKTAELHIYSQGGHGFGMSKRGLPVDGWIDRFGEWLASMGLLKPRS